MIDTNTATRSLRTHEGPRCEEIAKLLFGYDDNRDARAVEMIIDDLKDADADVSEDEYPAHGTVVATQGFPVSLRKRPHPWCPDDTLPYWHTITYATRRQNTAAYWRDRAARWKATSSDLLRASGDVTGADKVELANASAAIDKAIVVAGRLGA